MRCPHCKKEITRKDLSTLRQIREQIRVKNLEEKKKSIYNEICKSVHSIASLSKKTGIKRSSLNYYLDLLLDENKIYKERLENLTGRPTIIKKNGT